MSKAYFIKKTGNVKQLTLSSQKIPNPADDEVTIKHSFIGINHMDIHHRNGSYKIDKLPIVPGIEASGTITKLGRKVKNFKEGDKVIYGTSNIGSYCEERNIKADLLVPLDPSIPEKTALAAFVKGLTAHYMIFYTYQVKAGDTILVHGATGGVAHILCQWLKHLGATVIGTVGDDSKISAANQFGCSHVINYTKNNFAKEIYKLTNNKGVKVIYDSVGQSVLEDNIKSLSALGLLVNYGDVGGKLTNLDLTKCWNKSLFITKPNLSLYKSSRMELILSATTIFDKIKENILKPHFNSFSFKEIGKAQLSMENRKSIGSNIAEVN